MTGTEPGAAAGTAVPADSAKPVVGVLGLGRMGSVIAGHLARAGFPVVGYDPVARAEDFAPLGVTLVGSEAETVGRAELVFVVVGFDEEVKDLILAPDLLARCREDTVLAIVSTVLPATLHDIRRALPAGTALVDCPVARGQVAADEARLLAFAGGEVADVERCRPALEAFCTDVEYVGPISAGQAAKLANNMMLWSAFFGVFESMQLLRASGADLDLVRTALLKSSAASFALELWPNCRPVWGPDDLRIAAEVARRFDVEVPVTDAISAAFVTHPNPEEQFR